MSLLKWISGGVIKGKSHNLLQFGILCHSLAYWVTFASRRGIDWHTERTNAKAVLLQSTALFDIWHFLLIVLCLCNCSCLSCDSFFFIYGVCLGEVSSESARKDGTYYWTSSFTLLWHLGCLLEASIRSNTPLSVKWWVLSHPICSGPMLH